MSPSTPLKVHLAPSMRLVPLTAGILRPFPLPRRLHTPQHFAVPLGLADDAKTARTRAINLQALASVVAPLGKKRGPLSAEL